MNDTPGTRIDPIELERTAVVAATAAGRVLRRRFRGKDSLQVDSKGLHDYVTDVDREAEREVLGHLQRTYPDHAVMAEESAPDAGVDDYRWVVDPLDGTTNFIHGVTPFCVSVAVEDREGLLAGAVHDPIAGETFHAHRGGGARLNGSPIHCSRPETMGHSLIATGFPFRKWTRLDRYLATLEAFIRSTSGLRRAGSAAIDLAWTACGRYDGFWEIGLSRWDIAAGALLVREAGGVVTDIAGGDTFLDRGDLVAGGASLHPEMLEITRRHLSGSDHESSHFRSEM